MTFELNFLREAFKNEKVPECKTCTANMQRSQVLFDQSHIEWEQITDPMGKKLRVFTHKANLHNSGSIPGGFWGDSTCQSHSGGDTCSPLRRRTLTASSISLSARLTFCTSAWGCLQQDVAAQAISSTFPEGPLRKRDTSDRGNSGSSCDETFTFPLDFFFLVSQPLPLRSSHHFLLAVLFFSSKLENHCCVC